MKEWRAELVAKYGEAIIAEMEQSNAPWPCRDTMDGRRWCKVHDAPWPAGWPTTTGCTAWVGARAAIAARERRKG